MKRQVSVKLLTTVLFACAVSAGCAAQAEKDAGMSKASPAAKQAIKNASDAISLANTNDWMWSATEDLLKEAQAAAAGGDNTKAIALADQARFQAEAAIIQYNYEKDHPRAAP
jgi:hypothetical protein